jgi:hypothetical protein
MRIKIGAIITGCAIIIGVMAFRQTASRMFHREIVEESVPSISELKAYKIGGIDPAFVFSFTVSSNDLKQSIMSNYPFKSVVAGSHAYSNFMSDVMRYFKYKDWPDPPSKTNSHVYIASVGPDKYFLLVNSKHDRVFLAKFNF